MTKIERTQLLVAGGGPVGLLSALCAAKQGLEVTVIERSFRGTPRGHTTLLHPSSLRILAELGLSPYLLRSGQLIEEFDLRVNSSTRRIKLPYPALAITQALLEETLLRLLRRQEIELRATCEVTGLTQAEDGVVVDVVRREQTRAASSLAEERWELADSSSLLAQFVIGADGRESRVRRALGIRSDVRASERYAMFEYPIERAPRPELAIVGARSHFITPLLEGRARCSFQLDPDARGVADLRLLGALLSERAAQDECPTELHWSAIVDFEPAIAETFGHGSVWLVGDAARTTGPLGVQSMNRGLSDAWQVAEAMAAVAAGRQPAAALSKLTRTQRLDWLRTLGSAADFTLLPDAPPWLSDVVPQVVSALPVSGNDLEVVLRQIGLARRDD